MIDLLMDALKAIGRKTWEYFLVLSLILNAYLLIFGGCWEKVGSKFGFVDDVSKAATEQIDKVKASDVLEMVK